MTEEQNKTHHKFAVDCFNSTWELIEKEHRTAEEDLEMIHTAHASRYHWGLVGTWLEFQRGEWQISRVYSILGQGEAALFHAEAGYKISKENDMKPFDRAFACEAMARAHHVLGNTRKRDIFVRETIEVAKEIGESIDRTYVWNELSSFVPEPPTD